MIEIATTRFRHGLQCANFNRSWGTILCHHNTNVQIRAAKFSIISSRFLNDQSALVSLFIYRFMLIEW